MYHERDAALTLRIQGPICGAPVLVQLVYVSTSCSRKLRVQWCTICTDPIRRRIETQELFDNMLRASSELCNAFPWQSPLFLLFGLLLEKILDAVSMT